MQETGRLFSCCPSVLYKNGEKRNSIKCTLGAFLHLLLWPIFRQSHSNFRGGRNANASEIWAQLTKKSSHKIKHRKIPRAHYPWSLSRYLIIKKRSSYHPKLWSR